MDFIGEHEYAFFVADFGHLLEFFFGPHNATRVVRIAEDEHLASLHLLAEIVHIHAVSTIHQLQRIGYQSAIATGIQPRERTIYRRLDKHLVARIGKRLQRHAQARHDARHEVNHFLLHIESVAGLVPSDNGLEVAVRLGGIAQHRMFQTLADGFGYERCGGKVHIGHPKRNQVCASPNFFHIVYFHGRGAASVYHFIKIVFHSINCFSFPQKYIIILSLANNQLHLSRTFIISHMIKQDYLVRMILEIITLIANALLNKQKIRPQSWVEYDCLTRQILEIPSDQLKDLSPEEIIDKYEGDTNRMGKIELAAMTLLKISDELEADNLLLKCKLKQNGIELLKFVQTQGDTFSIQRMAIISMLETEC